MVNCENIHFWFFVLHEQIRLDGATGISVAGAAHGGTSLDRITRPKMCASKDLPGFNGKNQFNIYLIFRKLVYANSAMHFIKTGKFFLQVRRVQMVPIA